MLYAKVEYKKCYKCKVFLLRKSRLVLNFILAALFTILMLLFVVLPVSFFRSLFVGCEWANM